MQNPKNDEKLSRGILPQSYPTRQGEGGRRRGLPPTSFSTSADSLALLRAKYPGLAKDPWLEVVQDKA